MNHPSLIFSIIAAVVSIGGIFIAIGAFKSKISHNAETNRLHSEQIKNLVSKTELQDASARSNEQLAAAISRSDEMLEIMRKRAEEDRASGAGQYRELHALLRGHGERISALETQLNVFTKSLDEIKSDIKSGFGELKNELKELRKQA